MRIKSDFKEPKRFWSKVAVSDPRDCWEWLAYRHPQGYGRFQIKYDTWQAHRVAWILTYGPIPEGLLVCHRCDNRGCCNPYHLFLGTNAENQADSARKGRRGFKLLAEDVFQVRQLLEAGLAQSKISKIFGVDQSLISFIKTGKVWARLENTGGVK